MLKLPFRKKQVINYSLNFYNDKTFDGKIFFRIGRKNLKWFLKMYGFFARRKTGIDDFEPTEEMLINLPEDAKRYYIKLLEDMGVLNEGFNAISQKEKVKLFATYVKDLKIKKENRDVVFEIYVGGSYEEK